MFSIKDLENALNINRNDDKKNDIFIAESVQINKKMILLDKENFSKECIRNTILLRMLVQVLTLKEKEYGEAIKA